MAGQAPGRHVGDKDIIIEVMKRTSCLFKSIFVLLLFLFSARSAFAVTNVYVQYHLWYSTYDVSPDWRHQTWQNWSKKSWSVTGGSDGTTFLSPWRRETASRLGLPLTGPYSSFTQNDVIKYHFELAKAAGIDGMFASVYDGAWNQTFTNHLTIANPVGMKL